MLKKAGMKFPTPVKTGTTIAGIVFKVGVQSLWPATEILVRGTKIPGIMVRPDHFPLKNLVWTWNSGTMFYRNRRL